MTDEELQAIRARVEAATPGPWKVEGRHPSYSPDRFQVDGIVTAYDDPERADFPRPIQIVETDSGCYPPYLADAEFIAQARTDVPALLAEVERLRAELHAHEVAHDRRIYEAVKRGR